jgi:hypothetical protein
LEVLGFTPTLGQSGVATKSSFFKEIKENDSLWESTLYTPYQQI